MLTLQHVTGWSTLVNSGGICLQEQAQFNLDKVWSFLLAIGVAILWLVTRRSKNSYLCRWHVYGGSMDNKVNHNQNDHTWFDVSPYPWPIEAIWEDSNSERRSLLIWCTFRFEEENDGMVTTTNSVMWCLILCGRNAIKNCTDPTTLHSSPYQLDTKTDIHYVTTSTCWPERYLHKFISNFRFT